MWQEGPQHQPTHYATANCEFFSHVTNPVRRVIVVQGIKIGYGTGVTKRSAKREAAITARKYLWINLK